MRYAVGDIHGCLDELKKTLDLAGFSDSDMLYGVGDFCDRGTQNIETLRYVMGLPNFKSVFGNHDIWPYQHLDKSRRPRLDYIWVRGTWYSNGGRGTERQLPKGDEGEAIAAWLGDLPLVIDLGDVMIMHNPSLYILERFSQLRCLRMCEILGFFCQHDYDSFFWDRRIINHVEEPGRPSPVSPEDFRRICGDKLVVCGHTPIIGRPLYSPEFRLADIDTGAFATPMRGWPHDGRLTVLNLDSLEWIQNDGTKGSLTAGGGSR